jgi:hypothetical protein
VANNGLKRHLPCKNCIAYLFLSDIFGECPGMSNRTTVDHSRYLVTSLLRCYCYLAAPQLTSASARVVSHKFFCPVCYIKIHMSSQAQTIGLSQSVGAVAAPRTSNSSSCSVPVTIPSPLRENSQRRASICLRDVRNHMTSCFGYVSECKRLPRTAVDRTAREASLKL